uniref:Kinase n=1 Tax=Lates calcarifer TaxID=8187 RepID=A0A4W6EK79_LATCA
MSTTQHQVMMESSLALGRLELTPGSAAVGVNLTPRLPGAPLAKEKSGQRPLGPQGQAILNGCVPLSHQVAGHKYGVDKVGILQHPDGTVLKQLQPPPRGPREMQFYSMVFAEDCCDPCLLELQSHLPKYYGTWSSPDSPSDLYLKLEDVTRRFVKPCIMDVKLGQRSYDPFASQEKREQQIRKYPLMEEIGFLVLGMRVYKVCSDTFDSYDQHYGRGLVKDTIKDGLAKFFNNGVCLRKDAVSASIHRVQQILRWFESQHQLAFYASSLLFVYEGLPPSSSSSSSLSSLLSSPSISPTAVKNCHSCRRWATAVRGERGKRDRRGQGRRRRWLSTTTTTFRWWCPGTTAWPPFTPTTGNVTTTTVPRVTFMAAAEAARPWRRRRAQFLETTAQRCVKKTTWPGNERGSHSNHRMETETNHNWKGRLRKERERPWTGGGGGGGGRRKS